MAGMAGNCYRRILIVSVRLNLADFPTYAAYGPGSDAERKGSGCPSQHTRNREVLTEALLQGVKRLFQFGFPRRVGGDFRENIAPLPCWHTTE